MSGFLLFKSRNHLPTGPKTCNIKSGVFLTHGNQIGFDWGVISVGGRIKRSAPVSRQLKSKYEGLAILNSGYGLGHWYANAIVVHALASRVP